MRQLRSDRKITLNGLLMLLCVVCSAWPAPAEAAFWQTDTTGHFVKLILARADEITDPMELAVAPDGRVFFVEREGAVKVWDPETGRVRMSGFVPTWATHNEGMMGIALDPNFEENGWLYVYHSPFGPAQENHVVRFTVVGDQIDPASKKVLLRVPTERGWCCHSGGSLAFGPEGNLYIGTGDNTDPNDSNGYAPLDERPGRRAFDAQRTAANTMDLRGKILRIRPQPDGTYTIPEGNLFPNGEGGRPEIYVMGVRNAFRLAVDPETGWLYWGDVGPDASVDDERRGPQSYDEFNQAKSAGNYGWPYFVGNNRPYRDFDFATETSGPYFDPDAPVNESFRNTGARKLPPARPPWIGYPYGPSEEFPELGSGGRVAMAGPVYRYDPERVGPGGLPPRYDGSVFVYDWMRGWINEVVVDAEGNVQEINPFLPDMEFRRPMDMELGPDGSIYLIEWGTDYEGYNDDQQIVRIVYRDEQSADDPASKRGTLTEPAVSIRWPVNGGFFGYGEPIPFQIEAPPGVANRDVVVQPYVGHNTHTIPLPRTAGLEGSFTVRKDDSQAPYVINDFAVLEVALDHDYQQQPYLNAPADRIVLQPMQKEAEHYASRGDAQRDIEGSLREKADDVQITMEGRDGSYLAYAPVNLVNIDALTFHLAPLNGGAIEMRVDSTSGPLLASVVVPEGSQAVATGSDDEQQEKVWLDLKTPIRDPGGAHTLYLVFQGNDDGPIAAIDWLRFSGEGVSIPIQ